jgi:hypothetical protein
MKIMFMFASALVGAALLTACTQDVQAIDAQQIEKLYGVSGAYTETISTSDGPLKGTLVPITQANGSQAHLFIPERQSNDRQDVYLRDEQGLHPVLLGENASREELTGSQGVVATRPAPQQGKKRSWEKEALIIGGSAGGGAAIGAMAGGKKGAAIGATAGGVGGLVYDLLTRNK